MKSYFVLQNPTWYKDLYSVGFYKNRVTSIKESNNIMKKFFILIAIVLFGAIVWFQTKEIWDDKNFYVSKVDDSTRISFEKSSCDFYYDQLSEDERVIFEKILDLYHTKNRVEIILNEPCSCLLYTSIQYNAAHRIIRTCSDHRCSGSHCHLWICKMAETP